jgi:hypothetical protein
MALNSSMPWTLVGLIHLFPCTRSFFCFELSCCNKFGCVWSRRGFCRVRYCIGRNLIPLSKKYQYYNTELLAPGRSIRALASDGS